MTASREKGAARFKKAILAGKQKERAAELLFFLLLCLHGGYFYFESLLFLLIGLALFLYKSQRNSAALRDEGSLQGQDIFLPFLYLLCYMLPIFWGDKMHWYGGLKMLAPFLLGLALLRFFRPRLLLELAVTAYIWTLVLALGIYGIQIFWHYGLGYPAEESLLFLPVVAIKGRFTGFLQYANAGGLLSLLAGIYALSFGKGAAAIIVSGLSLGLSGSRTAWLLAVLFLGYYVWRERQLSKGAYFLAAMLTGVQLMALSVGDTRLSEGLNASELQTRLLYYKDGLTMLLKNPWGYGHYGYYMIQRQFQTGSTYFVKYIHSFPLQIALDGGIVSLALFLGLLGKALALLLRQANQLREEGRKLAVLLLALLAHAALDFDFEFSYVLLLVWLIYFYALEKKAPDASDGDKPAVFAFLGVNVWKPEFAAGGGDFLKEGRARKKRGIIFYGKRVGAGILLLLGLFLGFLSLQTYHGRYVLAAELGFTDAALAALAAEDEDREFQKGIAQKMENLPVKNTETFAFLRDYYYNRGELKTAINYGRQAVELAPLWMGHRQELMRIEYAYALTTPEDMAEVAADILELPQRLAKLKEERETALNVRHRPQWKMTGEMKIWYEHFQELYEMQKERL